MSAYGDGYKCVMHRPKKHEHGLLVVKATVSGWFPLPRPEQARARFNELVHEWPDGRPPAQLGTVRLIINGEEAARAEPAPAPE